LSEAGTLRQNLNIGIGSEKIDDRFPHDLAIIG
jgi:hypothetical protein